MRATTMRATAGCMGSSIRAARAVLFVTVLWGACSHAPPSGSLSISPVVPGQECQTLDQLLGPSEPQPYMARPLWRVRACPLEAGAALSAAIRAMGPVADTVELERRTWLTHYIVDERIIAAGLDVVSNEANHPEARIYALRTLIWQKAAGQLLTIRALTEAAPRPGLLSISSSYTNHYYTDLGYGTGEYPSPVLGLLPEEGYVDEMNRVVAETDPSPLDERLSNARAWFLWYDQDRQLASLLDEAR